MPSHPFKHYDAFKKSELRRNGQKAVVVIATDGESSDGDLAMAMRPLQRYIDFNPLITLTSDVFPIHLSF